MQALIISFKLLIARWPSSVRASIRNDNRKIALMVTFHTQYKHIYMFIRINILET